MESSKPRTKEGRAFDYVGGPLAGVVLVTVAAIHTCNPDALRTDRIKSPEKPLIERVETLPKKDKLVQRGLNKEELPNLYCLPAGPSISIPFYAGCVTIEPTQKTLPKTITSIYDFPINTNK